MMTIASMWAWFTPTILFCVANLLIATLFLASKSNTKTTNNPSHNHNHDNYENTNQSQNHDENQSQNQNQNQLRNQNQNLNQNQNRNQNQMRNQNQNLDQNQNQNQNQMRNQNYEYSFSPQIPIVSSFLDRARSINISSIIPTIITKTIKTNQENPQYTSLSRLSQSIFSACSYDTQPDSPRYPSSKKAPSILGRLKSIDFSNIYGDSQMITNSPGQLDRVNSVKSKIPATTTTLTKKKKTKGKLASVEIKKTRSEVRRSVSSDHEDDEVACLQRPETTRARRNADDDAKAENFITKFRAQLKLQRMDSLDRYNDMIRRP